MNPDNNNQAAPTTVGGVTFGGGNPATPVQNTTPEPQPQQPAQAPLDPIIESTGQEFDAIMNDASMQQGFQTPMNNQMPMNNNLSTPVVSPTHFDTQNTVNPIVIDPGNTAQNMQAKKEAKIDKQVKRFSALTVVFGILTALFAIAAVVGVVLFVNDEAKIADLNKDIEDKTKIIEAVEMSTGITIASPDDVPVYKATTGYIYLSSWNIKIKIPDNLEKVSYILNENYHQSICFNAVGKGVQYFPDFANIALNPGRMGCLTRISTSEGEFDPTTGVSYGQKVFTNKEYSYFYTASMDYSKDAANLGLEHTAAQYIKNMLTDNVEAYE